MLEKFKRYLDNQDISINTKNSYITSLKLYLELFPDTISKRNLLKYKKYLIENYKPKTVNLRIAGLNYFLNSISKEKLKLKTVKLSSTTYLENVISEADYVYLKRQLKRHKDYQSYFIIRFLCGTGARVSEFCQLKVEHVLQGYFDIYGKGNKYRRIYIPVKLQREALKWIKEDDTGYLFKTDKGTPFKPPNVVKLLKQLAVKYKINPDVMYPHSFRHRFAKNFIIKYNDISLLADLLGHESIETTRIYLRKTAFEQKDIIDRVVDW